MLIRVWSGDGSAYIDVLKPPQTPPAREYPADGVWELEKATVDFSDPYWAPEWITVYTEPETPGGIPEDWQYQGGFTEGEYVDLGDGVYQFLYRPIRLIQQPPAWVPGYDTYDPDTETCRWTGRASILSRIYAGLGFAVLPAGRENSIVILHHENVWMQNTIKSVYGDFNLDGKAYTETLDGEGNTVYSMDDIVYFSKSTIEGGAQYTRYEFKKAYLVGRSSVREITLPEAVIANFRAPDAATGTETRTSIGGRDLGNADVIYAPGVEPALQGVYTRTVVPYETQKYPDFYLQYIAACAVDGQKTSIDIPEWSQEQLIEHQSAGYRWSLLKMFGIGNLQTDWHGNSNDEAFLDARFADPPMDNTELAYWSPGMFEVIKGNAQILENRTTSPTVWEYGGTDSGKPYVYNNIKTDFLSATPVPDVYLAPCAADAGCESNTLRFDVTREMPVNAYEPVTSDFSENALSSITLPAPLTIVRNSSLNDPNVWFEQRRFYAWDWGNPSYCYQQLLSLGFSPADLEP
jgi:hypothetical protein